MHLPLTALVSIVGMASLTQAAECYAQSRGSNCVNKGQLLAYADQWCNDKWQSLTCDWAIFSDSSRNVARIGKVGLFDGSPQCKAAWNDIVNACHGSRNGGSWTFRGVTLNINFCQWS